MKTLILISISFISLSSAFSQANNISIVKKGSRSYLVEPKVNKTSISYDSILSDQTYFFGYNKNIITIYSKDTFKVIMGDVRAMHKITEWHKHYQVLQGNKIVWLNLKGDMFLSNPNENLTRRVCGTVPHHLSIFYKSNDSSFLYTASTEPDGSGLIKNTLNITALVGDNSLLHLNNTETLSYTSNNNFSKGLDTNIFFETLPSKKTNIIILNVKDKMFEKTILVNSFDRYYEMTNRNDLNTFHPFIFQKDDLYGYYPLTKIAKYIFINPLEENFARFELSNGKKGWLAIDGVEYLDK